MVKNEQGYWENEPDEVGNGDCRRCPHWIGYSNFCTIYNIEVAGPGYEATCNYSERIKKEEP